MKCLKKLGCCANGAVATTEIIVAVFSILALCS